ncbi:hypothetical protein AV530_002704 [Patagioenas fasciata monilis]|uniref:Uncharacterized protein n=1 Tax=Patagioenas fasciata monilis TaxID=372326 RepID=A0A1V4IPS1_PATFA|nr:hypothetical protein AV530_002704 [Patagioenas fasciata monilis]
MASCKQCRRLLECLEDNFCSQVTDDPARGNAILDLMVTNASELIGDVKIGGSLGSSDHACMDFTVLRDVGYVKIKVRTLIFRKAKFQLFEELVNRETAIRNKGAEQNCQMAFHGAQELVILRGSLFLQPDFLDVLLSLMESKNSICERLTSPGILGETKQSLYVLCHTFQPLKEF